jgi:hypothetical protein
VVWIPIAAWCAAAAIAVVVLGFCAYEIAWKTKRLYRDMQAMDGLSAQLGELRGELAEAQQRIAATGLR